MQIVMLAVLLLITTGSNAGQAQGPATQQPSKEGAERGSVEATFDDASNNDAQLLKIRRIYVDTLGEDAEARQLHAMLVACLTRTRRFLVTENKEKAHAILRADPIQETSKELFAYSEGTAVGRAAVEDSSVKTETSHYARISARLVNSDGDVIWATTQESKGAKYKGASADVADRVVKQLTRDVEKAEKQQATAESPKK